MPPLETYSTRQLAIIYVYKSVNIIYVCREQYQFPEDNKHVTDIYLVVRLSIVSMVRGGPKNQ